jgi:tetraacyldisaccharide 4'-kinase
MRILQILLFPVSYCYGILMMVRNRFYDLGILCSEKFNIPVISVGNLSFGGTGKTPHIEYLIRLAGNKKLTAALSRGYGRKSKGFLLAADGSNAFEIGDEPMQLLSKFRNILVAVDEKRVRGIHKLMELHPDLGLVLLDDAFQHRSVKPGISILLTDYHHLYSEDHVVPSGRLREFRSGAGRADIIVVTKTPKVFSPITRRRIEEEISPGPSQRLFFSFLTYGNFVPFNQEEDLAILQKVSYILLFTGIANDYPLQEEVGRKCADLSIMKFPDHHQYEMKDLEKIRSKFMDLPSRKKIILTTEKDIMRLKIPEFREFLKDLPLFYIPVEVSFHEKDKLEFDKLINDYVEKTQ